MPRLYGERDDGKVYEVQNRERRTGDVLVMQALTESQISRVRQLQNKGCSDTQIWRALHPEKGLQADKAAKTCEFALTLEDLTKAQLVLLIENAISFSAESLQNMTREDLIRLIRHFGHGKKPTRVTLTPASMDSQGKRS